MTNSHGLKSEVSKKQCKHGIPGLATFLNLVKIIRYEREDVYYCPNCKKESRIKGQRYLPYNADILGTNMCPRCKTEMKHPKASYKKYKCSICGQEVEG